MANNASAKIEQSDFRFRVESVSKLIGIVTPEIVVQGTPWKVRVCKEHVYGEPSLGVYLHCTKKKGKNPGWTHAAFATFRLMSSNAHVPAVEASSAPYIFDYDEGGRGTSCLIKWDQLLDAANGYVKDDAIVINILIVAGDASKMSETTLTYTNVTQCCSEHCWSTFRLTVGAIDQLLAVQSEVIKIRNLPFRFTVYQDIGKSLGFYLHSKWRANTSCEIEATCKVISSNPEKNIGQIRHTQTYNFQSFGSSLLFQHLISWDELLLPQNRYVNNNNIVIEVDIKASQPTSTHPTNPTDGYKRVKLQCSICLGIIHKHEISSITCGHMFCTSCITNYIEKRKQCPACGKPAKLDNVRRVVLPIIEWD